MALFNEAAWKKARNCLLEILAGYAADPPGFSMYSQSLGNHGQPKFDKFGRALLDCHRGSNDIESIHKGLVQTFGTWVTGVEMEDHLLGGRGHRHHHRTSERRRLSFPKVGIFDTWEIDLFQVLHQSNHGVLLFEFWSNASDYIPAPEQFGTVSLHSKELGDAVNAIVLPEAAKPTSDQQYLCERSGAKLLFLPVHGEAEFKVFTRLVMGGPATPDFETMVSTFASMPTASMYSQNFPFICALITPHGCAFNSSKMQSARRVRARKRLYVVQGQHRAVSPGEVTKNATCCHCFLV